MKYHFKLVEEWGCPIYVDPETDEHLYEACDSQRLSYWVCKLNEDNEIVDFVEQFQNRDDAGQYLREMGVGNDN